MPELAAIISAPTTAIQEMPSASLSPTNMLGSAEGKYTSRNMRQRENWYMRPTSTRWGSVREMPSMVFTRMGKNAARKITATFEPSPMPNHITSSGTQAIIGI